MIDNGGRTVLGRQRRGDYGAVHCTVVVGLSPAAQIIPVNMTRSFDENSLRSARSLGTC